jgi:hypothetical protein
MNKFNRKLIRWKPTHLRKLCKLRSRAHNLDPMAGERGGDNLQKPARQGTSNPCILQNLSYPKPQSPRCFASFSPIPRFQSRATALDSAITAAPQLPARRRRCCFTPREPRSTSGCGASLPARRHSADTRQTVRIPLTGMIGGARTGSPSDSLLATAS